MNIVRAWRDRDYRSSLNEEQLAALPENPAGSIDLSELSEEELAYMGGGDGKDIVAMGTAVGADLLYTAAAVVFLPAEVPATLILAGGAAAGFLVATYIENNY